MCAMQCKNVGDKAGNASMNTRTRTRTKGDAISV